MQKEMKHVVIIGAGFSGLFAAKKFFGKPVKVTLIDKNNYHTFNPLLYQVGAAEIEPGQIAYPVRSVIRKKRNINFLMSEVSEIKFKKQIVVTGKGDVKYDYLIIAPGSKANYFGIKGAELNSLPLKTLEDALFLRNHILTLFEKAVKCSDPEERKKILTFVITGGGPTGVEFAGAFAELVRGPLKKDFSEIKLSDINITLIDAGRRILPAYNEKSGEYALRKLEEKKVKVILESEVTRIDKGTIRFKNGESIKSHTILWTAGVKGVQFVSDVKIPVRNDSRLIVDDTLRVPGFDEVFVCGDLAYAEQDGVPLPMNAPVATQQGEHSALNILKLIAGKKADPFKFVDRGSMVAIGRNSAITKIKGFEVRGFFAWLLWLFIHILYLIGFRNKILVLISWFGDYILFERSGRMIIPSFGDKK
ncbi:MAG TPA: NAD(P)/FAD-dependent oxidoreductase [Spirochaetota bacterium]|nr:NAD(P)/FAD-dependent oxidoreductase [Spirochaetota bacterium]HPS87057.1 NAD(P)/FAD-dependent oxidoreductase [Spirochaetota bacterium]